MKFFKKNLLLVLFFLLGLIYVLIPGRNSIEDFPALANSTRSGLDGDTWQNPNLKAYFSNFRRDEITDFYKSDFEKKFLGLPLPVVRLNHPPELAYTYIRDQQESTFLEEYVRPLRESFFVNGYEPLIENYIRHNKTDLLGNSVVYENILYASKTTLRYYPSNPWFRVLVYFGIWVTGFYLVKLFIRVQKEY